MIKTLLVKDQVVDRDFVSESELNEFLDMPIMTGTRTDSGPTATFHEYFPGQSLITAGTNITVVTGTTTVTISSTAAGGGGGSSALTGADGVTVISGTPSEGETTISGFRAEFVSASGSLQTQIDAIDVDDIEPALTGSDGITITSGTSTIDIGGFRAEFVSASGTLSTQITDDIATHSGISDAHHTRYTDVEAISATSPFRDFLIDAIVDNAADIADNTTLIVTTSGHLQTQIDSIDVDETEPALTGSDGITIVSGTSTIDVQGFYAEFVAASGFVDRELTGSDGITITSGVGSTDVAAFYDEFVTASGFLNDHGNLSGLNDDDHVLYLLEDGTRPLSGDWDNTTRRIRNTGTSEVSPTAPTTPVTGLFWLDTAATGIAGSGSVLPLITITTDTTLTLSNVVVLCDADAGSILVTLPTTAGDAGRNYYLKKIDATVNLVTVSGINSETIDGGILAVLTVQYEAITTVTDGTSWFIL